MTPTDNVTSQRLPGHVVIVTGGGHGIGRAYCRRLAAEGAHVVVADLDGPAAVAVAESITTAGGSALAQTCDVRQLDALVAVVATAEERFGGVDGLINNAGMMVIRPISRVGFESIPEEEWAVFRGLTAEAFGAILLDLAAGARLSAYRKQVRGPKRPPPKRESGAKVKHVSTARVLEKRKEST